MRRMPSTHTRLWPRFIAVLMALGVCGSAGAAQTPLQLVTDPAALQAAEAGGMGFARWFGVAPGHGGLVSNQALAAAQRWNDLRRPLAQAVQATGRGDPQAGVGVARYAHRLFDVRWLDSPDAFFELVGVVNRLDRRPFNDGTCGETRLIYRLAYRTPAMQSRLPMTVSVELRADAPNAAGHCAQATRLWMPPKDVTGAALGRWLSSADGPLAPPRLAPERIARIAVNLQSMRWPSGVRPDLGGHAEYLLRTFHRNPASGHYQPAPLENTPDVQRLRADRALRAELLGWLKAPAQQAALDAGTLRIPSRFLATESRSVTPRGLARLANRPFAQVFQPDDWQAVPGSRTLGSPAAVLRRLDDLSCAGCHQSRAVAGFHLLGEDRPDLGRTFTTGNALAVAHSPHAQDELARRAIYLMGTLRQQAADPFRPLADGGGPGGAFGAACGLGDAGFAGWQCASGLRCQAEGGPSHDGTVGVCMSEAPVVGGLCEPSRIVPRVDGRQDRAAFTATPRQISCGGAGTVCERTAVGFPGGMCSGRCEPGSADGVCGRIAVLDDFNRCLAQRQPFAQCLTHTRAGQLRRCSATQPCREDYICAQADDADADGGACIPPYFLFQMRVDGHPSTEKDK